MGENTVKVVWGVPTEGHTPAMSLQSLLYMSHHLGVLTASGKFEFLLHTAGRIFTPMAREKILAVSLAVEADYCFMIDDDMLAPYDVFDKLYRHKVDIVAALAFARNPPYSPVLYRVKEGWDPLNKREYFVNEWIRSYPKNKLVECDAVGFGCVLIDMRVVKKMTPPYFMSACGTGEDILFCAKAKKQAGAHVFMDTSTPLGHISHPIIADEALYEKGSPPEEMERLFGAYERFRVLDVITPPKLPVDEDGCVVLAGVS